MIINYDMQSLVLLFPIPQVISTFYNIYSVFSFNVKEKLGRRFFSPNFENAIMIFPVEAGVKQHGNCTMVNPSLNLSFINKLSSCLDARLSSLDEGLIFLLGRK